MHRSLTAAARTALTVALFALAYLPSLETSAAAADAAGPKCSSCHSKLTSGKKVVHAAMDMGCESCHGGIAGVPHKNTTKIAKGLNADQPELCYGCHDKGAFTQKTVHAAVGMGCTGCHDPHASGTDKLLKADATELCYQCHDKTKFTKKTVHAAVSMGCTGCHNPHSTGTGKLLKAEGVELCYQCHDKDKFTKKTVHAAVGMGCTGCHDPHSTNSDKLTVNALPDLCFNCHDKGEFSKKNVHAAVQMGCLTCHNPHSTDNPGILVKSPYEICLECHDQVKKSPHAIAGFGRSGHPVGGEGAGKKKFRPVKDPKREGKVFSCASCHNPHSSDDIKLFRYPAKSSMQLCTNCHKF